MDLRIQKTLEGIEQEFLALRAKTPLNKIKVNEICTNAIINKSTFYRHYVDIFDLSGKIEDKTLDMVMKNFSAIDCLFTNPEDFISGLLAAIQKFNQRIQVLFGDRIDVFAYKVEARLKSHYLSSTYSPEDDIIMSFLIGGASHVFLNPKYDIETNAKTLAALLRNIELRPLEL